MDMMNLPNNIQEEFMSGKFAIKQTVGVFNGQWSEKTIIKDLIISTARKNISQNPKVGEHLQ
jgi:hypothetical protein